MAGDPPLGVLSTITALGETQLPSPRPAATGERAATGARYSVVAELGRGGMGIVDHVWDGDLMRDLAVKRIRAEHRDDPRLVAQFLWEARIGAHLDHPNIVPVHDLGRTADGPYFTMKRAAGRSLAEWLAQLQRGDAPESRFPLARRLRVMHQICQAIAFAHRRGVLHRDLKPANVLLGDDGEVLVTDWGLALPVPGPVGDELRRVMPQGLGELSAGTPLYMSPEQARGEPLDERSDIFTLGVMLYEVAALARPFEASSLSELASAREHAAPRPLRAVKPDAPRSLAAVIECAMAPRAADRYASAGELADDLERVIDGHTPVAEHASAATRFARYYLTRDHALDSMRVMDLDLLVGSGWFLGLASGAGLSWLAGVWWWWIALIAMAVTGYPPMARWVAARRAR
ncbi:MAG: serine/threonine-protein kinase [Acidobacteriota bacterium]